jgi:predicted NBD/HSP70 family sugar kinase
MGLFDRAPLPITLVARAAEAGLLPSAPQTYSEVRPAFEALCDLADRDQRAAGLLDDAVEPLARGVATLINVLDVGRVVLGGPSWPLVADRWLERLPHRLDGRLAARPSVSVDGSRLSDHGSAYGAAALVLHHFLSPGPALPTG